MARRRGTPSQQDAARARGGATIAAVVSHARPVARVQGAGRVRAVCAAARPVFASGRHGVLRFDFDLFRGHELTAEKIDRLLRKWLRRLPHPFPARDRAAGYRYDLSILQAEFSLTQVLDQPVTGRIFFEEVIRENLDIGRPSQVSLIFDRRINRCTPGRFRTRVITDGVVPSLHIDYKKSRIKQYHKLLEALRTDTPINDTRDFGIGRRIENLAELRKIGFAANHVCSTSNASVTIA